VRERERERERERTSSNALGSTRRAQGKRRGSALPKEERDAKSEKFHATFFSSLLLSLSLPSFHPRHYFKTASFIVPSSIS
jgi:hypothetical protein